MVFITLLFDVKVDVQFLIMTFMSPADICRLGATSRYWRALVRDPLLWRYFLLRDMPHWTSIDHVTMPQLDAPVICYDQSVDDSQEGNNDGMELKFDFMSEWVHLIWFFVKIGLHYYKSTLFSVFYSITSFSTDTWKAVLHADISGFLPGQPIRSWPHFFYLWCPHLSLAMPCSALAWSSWTCQ